MPGIKKTKKQEHQDTKKKKEKKTCWKLSEKPYNRNRPTGQIKNQIVEVWAIFYISNNWSLYPNIYLYLSIYGDFQ